MINVGYPRDHLIERRPMTILFVTCFAIGVAAVLGSLVVGEFGGAGASSEGSPFMSLTTIATAIFGFGAGSLTADLMKLGTPAAIGSGVTVAVLLVALFRGLLLPYMLRQQSNSHFGRSAYIGLIGRVEMSIPVGGWGEVSLIDPTGSRVRLKAVSDEEQALPTSTRVYISDADAQFIRVVAVPDDK